MSDFLGMVGGKRGIRKVRPDAPYVHTDDALHVHTDEALR